MITVAPGTCRRCGETSEELRDGGRPDHRGGKRRSICTPCQKLKRAAWLAAYREANREDICLAKAAYREANREEIRRKERERYWRDPEATRTNNNARPSANPARRSELTKARRQADLPAARSREAATRERTREQIRTYAREWYARNRERVREYQREARAKNPERFAEKYQRRQARLAGAPVIERVDRRAIILRDKSICHICGEAVVPVQMSLDHVIPLSRGGCHTAENLKVAHIACNAGKGAR